MYRATQDRAYLVRTPQGKCYMTYGALVLQSSGSLVIWLPCSGDGHGALAAKKTS